MVPALGEGGLTEAFYYYREFVFLYGDVAVPVLVFLNYALVTMIVNFRLRNGRLPHHLSEWGQVAREGLSNVALVVVNNVATYSLTHAASELTSGLPSRGLAFVLTVIVREVFTNLFYTPSIVLLAAVGKQRQRAMLAVVMGELRRWWAVVIKSPLPDDLFVTPVPEKQSLGLLVTKLVLDFTLRRKPPTLSAVDRLLSSLSPSECYELLRRATPTQLDQVVLGVNKELLLRLVQNISGGDSRSARRRLPTISRSMSDAAYTRVIEVLQQDTTLLQQLVDGIKQKGRKRLSKTGSPEMLWNLLSALPPEGQRKMIDAMEEGKLRQVALIPSLQRLAQVAPYLNTDQIERIRAALPFAQREQFVASLDTQTYKRLLFERR